jgi:FKBP12-rapamycin complex-associated protein
MVECSGTYKGDGSPSVRIVAFSPVMDITATNQRPRKFTIRGSDGVDYFFGLKGKTINLEKAHLHY